MKDEEKKVIIEKGKRSDVEFSNEFNIGLDYNANLKQSAKDEIDKVKEFYDSRL